MHNLACKYRQPGFWEWTLGKQDVRDNLFVPPGELQQPAFINAYVVDERRFLLDSNWACYPDIESVLGFVQYIFLSTAFYYVPHPENDRLMIPIQSTAEFLETVQTTNSPHRLAMGDFAFELSAVRQRIGEQREIVLRRFCSRFSRHWERENSQLGLHIFSHAEEVVSHLKELVWYEELFEEEFGYSYAQLDKLCIRFETEPFAKHLLLS